LVQSILSLAVSWKICLGDVNLVGLFEFGQCAVELSCFICGNSIVQVYEY